MRLPPPLAAAVLVFALAACSKKPEPSQQPPPRPQARASVFTLKDLAAASAVDARLARLSLVAGDLHQALAPEPGAKPAAVAKGRAKAKALLPALEAARAEAESALAAVAHPIDRSVAQAAVAAARAYSERLGAAVASTEPASQADLFAARDAFGGAISGYRASRVAWRLDAPEPKGAERDFAEARREMERVESDFGARTRVAPRESGHEFDPAAARMTGQMAAGRAKAAAEQLAPPLREAAVRYAEAEAKALDAFTGLFQAPVAERPAISRAYHAAKADALAALADYFAALAAR